MIKKIKSAGLIATAFLPAVVFAQSIQEIPPPGSLTSFQALLQKMCVLLNYVFTVLLVLAVLFIIIAAFRYLTASGDPEKVKKANHTLIYAAVAVLVAVMARAIPVIVSTFIGTAVQGC